MLGELTPELSPEPSAGKVDIEGNDLSVKGETMLAPGKVHLPFCPGQPCTLRSPSIPAPTMVEMSLPDITLWRGLGFLPIL